MGALCRRRRRPSCGRRHGFAGVVRSDLPAGSGLSSSAALEVACALALGADVERPDRPRPPVPGCRARRPRRPDRACSTSSPRSAVSRAAGCVSTAVRSRSCPFRCPRPTSPSGLSSGPVPDRSASLATPTGSPSWPPPKRSSDRCATQRSADLDSIDDPVVRARARHVLAENGRVDDFAAAIAGGDLAGAGALMSESHASLSGPFDCSTPEIDELCARCRRRPACMGRG